jgi:hypothetical protein
MTVRESTARVVNTEAAVVLVQVPFLRSRSLSAGAADECDFKCLNCWFNRPWGSGAQSNQAKGEQEDDDAITPASLLGESNPTHH